MREAIEDVRVGNCGCGACRENIELVVKVAASCLPGANDCGPLLQAINIIGALDYEALGKEGQIVLNAAKSYAALIKSLEE